MNEKIVTKRKGSKTKADNQSPEVFVLPPNLLERLGINLGNIGSASESTTESQVTDLNIISKDKDVSGNKCTSIKDTNTCVTTSSEIESSIIETAKLMKNSVFLSPTFISQNTSVIQGEIEIAGNVEPEALQEGVAVSLMNNEFCDKKSNSNVYKENYSAIALSTQSDHTVNGNATLHDVDVETVFDDHADEAYSSDGSNSNIGCAAKTSYNKTNKNKINIISEQIIHPSQFYKLKSNTLSQPAENKFIHVPISTMITSHNKNNSYYENIVNIDLNPKATTIINPTEIIVANECTKPDQNSVILHTNISSGDISQNIDKIDTCAEFNEISSEFLIVTQNQEQLQQDGKILRMFLNKDTFLKDEVTVGTDEVVPCHLNTVDGSNIMNYEILEFPTSAEIIYSDHYNDKFKEIRVVDTDSSENKDNSFVTNTVSHEIIPESVDTNIVTPCGNEPENEDGNTGNSSEDETCNMKNDFQIEQTHLDNNDFQEVLQNITEFETIAQKNVKQLSNVLNSKLDLINQKKDSTFTDDQKSYQFGTGDLFLTQSVDNCKIGSKSAIGIQKDINVNKAESSHLNQCNDDKNKLENHPEFEASIESPRLNMLHEEQEIEKDDINHEQKDTREPSEPRIVKISSNENCYKNSNVTVENKLSVIQEDKVREIAHYLSKFADMKKRNNIKERKMACSKTLSNMKHTTNSKSSIQGVEKPGGSNKQIRNGPPTNTYGCNRRERRKTVPAFVQSMCSDSHVHTQSIDETVSNSLDNVSKEIELCLCDDFGRLTSYDSENIYEHIHFWNNVKSDVTPDIIFSIYNQDISVIIDDYVKSDHDIDEEYFTETSTTTDRKICWHEIKLTHEKKIVNDYDVDFNNEEINRIEDCIQEEEKHIPRMVDPKNMTKNKRDKIQKTEKGPLHLNNITGNLLQSPEAPPNNKIVRDEHSTSTGKKRKRSTKPDDNDVSPAKKQSKQLLPTEAAASHVKTRGSGKHPAKGASTALVEKGKSGEQASFVEPSSATATGDQSFIPVNIVNDKECPSTPANEATNNCADEPSTLPNEDQQMNCSGLNKDSSEVSSEGHGIKNEVTNADLVQCGVCGEFVQNTDWSGHIASRHDYLAWKHGEPPVDVNDETAVREHLYEITKACGGLTCAKCGLTRKYVKAYLSHFTKCNGLNESQNDSTYNISSEIIPKVESERPISKADIKNNATLAAPDLIKCGVCEEFLVTKDWIHHIGTRHDYLAWKVGDSPLDVTNEVAVKDHLYELTKALGGLRCAKCGLVRKYVKAYLSHIRSCDGLDESQNDSTYDVASDVNPASPATELVGFNESSSNIIVSNEEVVHNVPFTCGVCKESMQEENWITHISSQHGYMAWKLGDLPLDINDEVAVREHLNQITKAYGGLTCAKCGVVRKTAKPYLNHVKRCNGLNESHNDSACDISTDPTIALVEVSIAADTNTEEEQEKVALVECGVCHEKVLEETWETHLGSHNYLAWKHGETALDVNNEDTVKGHLYALTKKYSGLTCTKCGLTRKYVKAYLTHIKDCDGPNETADASASNQSMDDVSGLDLEPPNADISTASREDEALEKCAICGEYVLRKNWHDHRASKHNYLAWVCGEKCLDIVDDAALREHLYTITVGSGLRIPENLINGEYIKSYVDHIKFSHGLSVTTAPDADLVKCGVCGQYMVNDDWHSHLATNHEYLAWKDGEPPFDVSDQEETRVHLQNLAKELGGLNCPKCGLRRKYAKSYLHHVRRCDGNQEDTNNDHDTTESSRVELNHSEIEDTSSNTCGVCNKVVRGSSLWMKHIFEEHNYLAWKDGETPLDVDDEDQVYQHLYKLSKELGGLTCTHCNISRKYVKPYLEHIKNCNLEDTDHDTELNQSETKNTRSYKCGACKKTVEGKSLWIKHLYEEHNYLAWKDGETPLDMDDEDQVYQHLYKLSKKFGGLICKYCSLSRKYVKSYLEHVKNCNQKENDVDETPVPLQNLAEKVRDLSCPKCGLQSKYIKTYLNHLCKCEGVSQEGIIKEEKKEANVIICGVCSKVVNKSFWAKHLSENHNYLAWKEGDNPLDLNDQEKVNKHLYDINKEFGGLTCKYCGKTWKYVKTYSEHIKYCGKNSTADESMSETVDANNSTLDATIEDSVVVDFASGGVCAVCQNEVEAGKWIQHTQREHNYLAWREGEKPWNVEDFADINQYLYVICKRMDGLTCRKCGIVRKYVKSYLNHVKTCNATHFDLDPSVSEGIGPVNKDVYQCAMCKEHIKPAEWKDHAMKKHYNVTWIIGETPIDIKNPYVVEKYLKDYKRVRGTLKCNMCGATRVSFSGFYAHIITCGKTEEEIDMFRSVCEICNNPYLCIYKNQHAMIHRVQAYTAELKAKTAEKAEDAENAEKNEDVTPPGKRRAAVKARSVIEKYSDNMSKLAYTCQSCGYGTDVKEELDTHKCDTSNGKDFSGEESSAAELGSSDDESPDSDVDSNISNEVNDDVEAEDDDDDPQPKKRIRIRENSSAVSKITRIPFKVEDPNSYIRQGDKDFCSTHLTDEVLYPRWLCKYEAVLDSELARYLPPIEQSCKVKVGTNDWITFDRFEAKRDSTATTIFVGASIVCISWVPLRVEDIDGGGSNFLAVACHNDADCPRYQGGETPIHENLIQIWNYTANQELPKLVLGIALDFGTVWSMDWCPSGARDTLSEDTKVTCRLGLLAVACSSGSAYIISVPHPSTVVKSDRLIYKLNPVAELRMTMCTDRKRYQATSVSWSKQQGHMIILVGYADGSTAFYDLHTKSPLLRSMENDIEVFYPYHDERPHNTCITGTDLYPVSGDDPTGCGAGAWVAPTGALLTTRAGAAGAAGRARLHVASLGVEFAPHAGSAVLAGDDAIMHTAISELVWVPPGRRLGAVRAVAGCARCGRVVASMPPTLRVMRPHPAYDLKKQVVGMLEMTHLAKKRKKQVNDELAMTIEPLTYVDAVSKYGIELKKINRNDRAMQHQCASKPKAHCPERFPLADVKSMAFCPSRKYHEKLAVATHAGILFIITLS